MRRILRSLGIAVVISQAAVPARGQSATSAGPIPLDATTKMALTNTRALWVEYRGRQLSSSPRSKGMSVMWIKRWRQC